jgi:acylphosphatase
MVFSACSDDVMEVGAHIVVKGMVQGVGFRYFVYNRATNLGLKGLVRNLYNGDVEIEVEGDRSLIEEFIKEVKVGPRAAHVRDVAIQWKETLQHYNSFEVH